MYPCFTFCHILGMFPYNINALTFEISKPKYILSTVVTCVCCIFDLAILYSIIISKAINYKDITSNLEAINYFIFSGFILIMTHILTGPRMRLLQTILKISLILSRDSFQKLSKLVHLKDILGNIFLFVYTWIYFYKKQSIQYKSNYLNVFAIVFGTYIALVALQMNFMYMNCVYILKACFKKINDRLSHMQRLVINDIKSSVPRSSYHIQRNQFLLIEIKTIKKQHLMVSNAVQMLNMVFSLQLLAVVTITFVETTFELYSYVVRWQGKVFISLDRRLLDCFLTSMSYYVIKLALLVWFCETGKNQAQEISTIVHDVINSTSDEQIKNELQLFCLQILHRKNIFSAKGLTIDATLLTGIVGSITIYMLILIQFLIIMHSCE
ncbi:hypothetical protein P5V15_009559 [Pogonomyrmex californicus]